MAGPQAQATASEPPAIKPQFDRAVLQSGEVFWRDHQRWLEQKGYMLRPRYHPSWVASWRGADDSWWNHEDSTPATRAPVMDATRIDTGEIVVLKRISKSEYPTEAEIMQFFTAEPLGSHPRNHCAPLLDHFDVPGEKNYQILVTPLLRKYNDPRFKSVGEAVEFFRQIFVALQFMHQLKVAHRDCTEFNVMMDPKPTFPKLYHPQDPRMNLNWKGAPQYYTRTARPTKYYLIDFGLSRKYDPEGDPPLEVPVLGGDMTVPEFQDSTNPCDPFPVDVYYIGNMINEDFLLVGSTVFLLPWSCAYQHLKTSKGVEFMIPLINDMIQDDPSKRPTMDEVVTRFDDIRRELSWWKLRSRLIDMSEGNFERFVRSVRHAMRTTIHVIRSRPAIPTPND